MAPAGAIWELPLGLRLGPALPAPDHGSARSQAQREQRSAPGLGHGAGHGLYADRGAAVAYGVARSRGGAGRPAGAEESAFAHGVWLHACFRVLVERLYIGPIAFLAEVELAEEPGVAAGYGTGCE